MSQKFLLLTLCVGLLSARVIIDSNGKAVQIPDEITRASPLHHTSLQIALMLGNKDKIIFNSPRIPPAPLLEKVFPEIRLNPNKSGSHTSSVETIIASKPQVVFGALWMEPNENANKQLETAGVIVVSIHKFLYSLDGVKKQVRIISEIFGGQSIKKAKEWLEFTDNNVKFVSQRVAKIKNKKRVLYLAVQANTFRAMGKNFALAEYIGIAGGINAGASLTHNVWNLINEEQVIIFDPDVIITNSNESVREILANPAFKWIKAVKNKQIFIVPSGVFWWGVPNGEGAMAMLWLGKILYPELFADLNLESKVREFYTRFYNYKLSDDELELILNPK